jgi:hypothetical protein
LNKVTEWEKRAKALQVAVAALKKLELHHASQAKQPVGVTKQWHILLQSDAGKALQLLHEAFFE